MYREERRGSCVFYESEGWFGRVGSGASHVGRPTGVDIWVLASRGVDGESLLRRGLFERNRLMWGDVVRWAVAMLRWTML